MNIRDLQYFTTVAKEKHFSRAAKICHVSQPTLSMQIKKLEEELGLQLFEREGKKVVLTYSGKAIFEKAQKILEESLAIENIAKHLQDPFFSPYKVGVIPTLAPDFLPIILPKLKKKFPLLKLRIWEGQTEVISQQLSEGELDFLLLALPLHLNDTVEETLLKENFNLALNPNHPLSKYDSISQKQLKGQKLLLLEEGHCLRDQALEVCDSNQAYEEQEFRFTSLSTLIEIIKNGHGMTLLPELSVKRFRDKQLKIIPFKKPQPFRKIGIVWRKSHPFQEMMKKISSVIKDLFPNGNQ
ncbi:MAG: LysR family transcriptional regulator [Deltaproteobacteria bacterium]|nr:LysR family transcriptional regulator [Deltaproteobacteria bacterium]